MEAIWGRKSLCCYELQTSQSVQLTWETPGHSRPPPGWDDAQPGLSAGTDQSPCSPSSASCSLRRKLGVVPDPWASQSHFTSQNIPEIQSWEQAEKRSKVAASLL